MNKKELEKVVYEVAAIVLATPYVHPEREVIPRLSATLLNHKLQEYINQYGQETQIP